MNDIIFNKEKKQLNQMYFNEFGVVPCMQNFNCSREEYIDALKIAINTKTKIEELLQLNGKPIDEDSLV